MRLGIEELVEEDDTTEVLLLDAVEDPDLLAKTLAVSVRLEVVVREIEEEEVLVRVDVTEVVTIPLAVDVLDAAVVRVLVVETKEVWDDCADLVTTALGNADRVDVDVRVAVRLLVAVSVGKILLSSKSLPRGEIIHCGTTCVSGISIATSLILPMSEAAARPRSRPQRLILLSSRLK